MKFWIKVFFFGIFLSLWVYLAKTVEQTINIIHFFFSIFVVIWFSFDDWLLVFKDAHKHNLTAHNFSDKIISTTPDYSSDRYDCYIAGSYICPINIVSGKVMGKTAVFVPKSMRLRFTEGVNVILPGSLFKLNYKPASFSFLNCDTYLIYVHPEGYDKKRDEIAKINGDVVSDMEDLLTEAKMLLTEKYQFLQKAVDNAEVIVTPRQDSAVKKIVDKINKVVKTGKNE